MNGISGAFSDYRLAKGNWNFTDDAGGTGTYTLFTVTGDVMCRMAATVDVALTSTGGTGTAEVGVVGNTAALLIQDAADATAFAIGDSWTLITAANTNALQIADEDLIIGNGVDIIMTVATAALTAGDIDFYCLWRPLSEDGNVVGT